MRDAPVGYIARTRAYYRALGFDHPYEWGRFGETPFARPEKPLAECRVAIVTTASRFDPAKGDQGPDAPYNAAAKFYEVYAAPSDGHPDVRISHVAYDRDHTTARDPGTWFPLAALRRAAASGRIGEAAPRFFGLPTNRSQRVTRTVDAVRLVELARADRVDAAILVPNCPVCHQSVSIAARVLEASGIRTVIMGCALDIVERAGVPRFVFSDFPLGNSAGRPGDKDSQDLTLGLALDLLDSAEVPGTTTTSPLKWSDSEDWKLDYSNSDLLSAEELARRRVAFDRGRNIARELRGRTPATGPARKVHKA